MKKRIAIFISGTGSNMLAILDRVQAENGLLNKLCEVVFVFSNEPNAKGLLSAQNRGIPTKVIPSKGRKRESFDSDIVALLALYQLDYLVFAGYMRIASKILVDAYPQRIINIHPADTDEFKGLGAYEWTWEQRKTATKITVHYVDTGVDTGKVIAKADVDLSGCSNLAEVKQRGLAVEHQFYSQCLERVFKNDE